MIPNVFLYALLAAPASPSATPSASELPAFELAAPPALLTEPAPLLQDDTNGFSWTFAELNYMWLDSDNADQTFDGFELKGSLEIFFNLFLQASYAKLSDDSDFDQYGLGLGWHFPVGDRVDLFGILAWSKAEIDGGGVDEDEDGMTAEAGARFWLTPKIELNGQVEWADIDESDTGVGVGARYYLIDMLSLGVGAHFTENNEILEAGVRASF